MSDRILTALLIGPMTRRQIAAALHRSLTRIDQLIRELLRSRYVIRIATPTFSGKLSWRYALTHLGTEAAHRSIAA